MPAACLSYTQKWEGPTCSSKFCLIHGLTTVARRLAEEHGVRAVRLRVLEAHDPADGGDAAGSQHRADGFGALDRRWQSSSQTREQWQELAQHAFVRDESDATLSLREVADSHGGEVWFQLETEETEQQEGFFARIQY